MKKASAEIARSEIETTADLELISLFSGAGGLDWGFEAAGFSPAVAIDIRADAIKSYNHNRPRNGRVGRTGDVAKLDAAALDALAGRTVRPIGIIGGPPCQSFSRATHSAEDDPRHGLPLQFARILRELNARAPVHFFAFENVPGLLKEKHAKRFASILSAFRRAGFNVFQGHMNASAFGVPQDRPRLILVGLNRKLYPKKKWEAPKGTPNALVSVKTAIGGFPEPRFWERGLTPADIPHHPNHWCMVPKSKNFETAGALVQGTARGRSFRTLSWDRPSPTIAYGNREVHIHPDCKRRLSVYEALRLQGFPKRFELTGTLSSQIQQVSEAVPPPLGKAIAQSILEIIRPAEAPIPLGAGQALPRPGLVGGHFVPGRGEQAASLGDELAAECAIARQEAIEIDDACDAAGQADGGLNFGKRLARHGGR
jgi:DNA (cytosine-5)-methyltransferase 1